MHPIIYQNIDKTVTLIDIPASITHAQGISGRTLSSTARDEPFPSTEPKCTEARAKVLSRIKTSEHEYDYGRLIQDALAEITKKHQEPWCLPRWVHDEDSEEAQAADAIEMSITEQCKAITKSAASGLRQRATVQVGDQTDVLHDWDASYYNSSTKSATLQIETRNTKPKDAPSTKLQYFIPSQASFLVADCNSTEQFRNHIRWMSSEHDHSRKFDFILLDPPWENRSVKRKANYTTSSVQSMIEDMDLSSYLQANGFVGIWVTNKSAHRDLVLGEGGLFQSINVTLVEEWIWIKTTTKGAPITELDGVWRKPYEVMLLGQAPQSRLQLAQPAKEIRRRVIAGVPDLHSRKPCLKTLIEPYLPQDHQVLEVFARYLVQGWTSWGNEVLKFNYEGYHREVTG